LPQAQQQRGVTSSQAEQQQYPVAGVYNTQTGLQSPFLSNQPQFQQPSENTYFASNPSPRSQHSGASSFYPTGKYFVRPRKYFAELIIQ
jgi:hypothetical protein